MKHVFSNNDFAKKDNRNTNIELLRLGLMFAIFVYHIVIHGLNFKEIGILTFFMGGGEIVEVLVTSLFAPATYCFMFISGYYGINFSKQRFFTLELWMILASLVVCLINILLGFKQPLLKVIYSIMPVCTFKWWFMTFYMLIMIIAPIINLGIAQLSKRQVQICLLLLLGYNCISFLQFRDDNGCTFLGLLAIYVLGRYCKLFNIEINQTKAIKIWSVCLILQLTIMFLCCMMHRAWIFRVLNYNLPFVMGMSVSLFYIVKNLKRWTSPILNRILSSTLFIYLITDGLYEPFYKWIVELSYINLWIGIFISLFSITLSMFVGQLIIKITNLLLIKVGAIQRKM